MIIGRNLINSQYSEKLYSTGDYELDNLLERAFCEGYEYAQREYAEKCESEEDEKAKKKSKRKKVAKKVALGAGIAAATYGASKLANVISGNKYKKINDRVNSGNLDENETQKANELLSKLAKVERVSGKISNPVDNAAKAVGRGVKAAAKATVGGAKKGVNAVKKVVNKKKDNKEE